MAQIKYMSISPAFCVEVPWASLGESTTFAFIWNSEGADDSYLHFVSIRMYEWIEMDVEVSYLRIGGIWECCILRLSFSSAGDWSP